MVKSKRAVQALNRFRRLVRQVILNQSWLSEQSDQKLTGNVKRNISVLVRVRRKIGLLTMEEKSLIRTPHVSRTVIERRRLVALLSSLQCFAHIPPKVRARLVPVIRFLIVPKGRLIIREGDNPLYIYFVLTGEVVVSFKEFAEGNNEFVDKILTVCMPGDCIGDVEMIEGRRRTATYTASSDTELLVIDDDDFKSILEPFMGKQWFQTKEVVKSIEYFDFFSEFQSMCACKIGVVHQFEPLQTVYVEDKGKLGFTYFVISGECMIMQCLKIKVKDLGNQKLYELVSTSQEEQNIFQELDELELLRLLKENEIFQARNSTYELDIDISVDEEDENLAKKEQQKKRNAIKRAYNYCDRYLVPPKKLEIKSSSIHTANLETIESEDMYKYNDDVYREKYTSLSSTSSTEFPKVGQKVSIHRDFFRTSDRRKSAAKFTAPINEERSSSSTEQSFSSVDENEDGLGMTSQGNDLSEFNMSSSEFYYIENHFIDVGTIGPGGVFGLGEELKHRIILANTNVQCLVVPRFWLFENEQNPGNVWQRRRFHLECTIPSREQIFDNFLNTRKWQKFKSNYIDSILKQRLRENPTKPQDVPVFCRILDGTDNK